MENAMSTWFYVQSNEIDLEKNRKKGYIVVTSVCIKIEQSMVHWEKVPPADLYVYRHDISRANLVYFVI